MMKSAFKAAFSAVHAEQTLKDNTLARLMKRQHKTPPLYRLIPIGVCAVLVLAVGTFFGMYFSVQSYISVDVNPSLELGINRFDRVVSARGYNSEGEQLLSLVNVNNFLYTEAVTALLDGGLDSYVKQDSPLTLTVASKNEEEMLTKLQSCTGGRRVNFQVCTLGEAGEAQSEGIPPGKYSIYREILQHKPDFTAAECADSSMRELRTLLESLTEEAAVPDEEEKGDSNGQKEGNGHGKGQRDGRGNKRKGNKA